MYLHLGNDILVRSCDIVGVFDLDNTTVSKNTRELLTAAQKEDRVVNVSMELPRSFVVCRGRVKDSDRETIYVSPLSPSTLLKRARLSKNIDMSEEIK